MTIKSTLLSLTIVLLSVFSTVGTAQEKKLWSLGNIDASSAEFALAPNNYKDFLKNDFGWEDTFYAVGFSKTKTDFPYVLAGAMDSWAGTAGLSGIRSHVLNILFSINKPLKFKNEGWSTINIHVLDCSSKLPPLVKITLNGTSWTKQLNPGTQGDAALVGELSNVKLQVISLKVPSSLLNNGGNELNITTIDGSWLVFDQIECLTPVEYSLNIPEKAMVKSVKEAAYSIQNNGESFQALLVDVQHLKGISKLTVQLDDHDVFNVKIRQGNYVFEVPMPVVSTEITSSYKVFIDNKQVAKGQVNRGAKPIISPADYVNTKLGTAHSRWMIAPGPWMPFGMVKLSPDNQNSAWQGGYQPTFENIGCFSHIHEWTMAGLGMMPTNGPLKIKVGDQRNPDEGYRSRIDKQSEHAPLGSYHVQLTDYDIKVDISATTRASFQRYTYPENSDSSRVMIDLLIPAEYSYLVKNAEITQVNKHRIEGFSHQITPNTWAKDINQEYTIYFVMEFDQAIQKMGTWENDSIIYQKHISAVNPKNIGAFVRFNTSKNKQVQVRTGISYVSIKNAGENLNAEITRPFHWNFEAVVQHQKEVWNSLLSRVEISTNNQAEKTRFYSNMYRSLASRNIFSDVDGSWVDANEIVQKFSDPAHVALGCDAFWNTFWNLNQFWNLVTPEWSSKWVNSQLAMFDATGYLAKGPAGMEYVPVMVAEHEIPLIVGAYQMGIRDFDAEKAFKAVYKMQTTKAVKVGDGLAGNADLSTYLKHKYVPYDKGRFSNSLEYSFDDYTVGQFAKALGKQKAYDYFNARGNWWKNVIDTETGYARMKDAKGDWLTDFDPYKSGANHHYVEGNAWQLTYFVPQNIPELAKMIGKNRFIERLDWGFEESYKWRYNAPNELYWDYPIMQGNQQSMHFAYLFNWVQKPWLTQKWVRAIMDRYYGFGISNAYLGDEDQGQMSAWFIMSSIGLFQTDGGTSTHPIYEIGSPIFDKVTINLGEQYGRGKVFTIEAKNNNRLNKYIQKAYLNGKPLQQCWFYASELLKGGELILEMGDTPNKQWGIKEFPSK
ncbi:MAG: hypothetical protein COB60_00795 [Flavobacteriaceae bacterium]|nr:MAG: hypothetical protein COB60_00795 [Flavobacteriaceae bacterium]